MKAAIYNGPYEIDVGQRPDPKVQERTDAVVRVVLSCVCGSDLWYYRGQSPHALGPIGHEYIGVIEDVGAEVRNVRKGDLVVAPFTFCDGSCPNCRAGWPSNCLNGGSFGNHGIDGGQGEAVRSPLADATLVKVPGSSHSDETLKSLLSLSDVIARVTTPRSALESSRAVSSASLVTEPSGSARSSRPSASALNASSPSAVTPRARGLRKRSARPTFCPNAARKPCSGCGK